jgi:predicted regulator of Ras-like GTPase activity (Roadblock/LC7/MglB family)
MVTDSRAHGHAEPTGASPTVWAIFFSSLAISIALVLEGSVRINPDWGRWWAAILGLEISAYTLTLFLPPFARVNVLHALCRVATGMLMRAFVVALCALLLVVGGDAGLVDGLKLFWAAHWPVAIGQIVCVAVAVYAFRVIAMRRGTPPRQGPLTAAPVPTVARTPEELLEELMAESPASDFAVPAGAPAAEAPPAGQPPMAPAAQPPQTPTEEAAPPSGSAVAVEAPPPHVVDTFPEAAPAQPELTAEVPPAPEAAARPAPEQEAGPPAYRPVETVPPAPIAKPPAAMAVESLPAEAPGEPGVEEAEPSISVMYPEPVPLPGAQPPSASSTVQPSAAPEPEVPTAPPPAETVREEPTERPEPTPIVETAPAPASADEAVTAEVEAPRPPEVPQPPVAVEPEAPAATHQPAAAEVEAPSEEAPTEPPAQPVQGQVGVSDPTTSGALKLPAEVVLAALPPDLLDRPIEEVAERVPDGVFSFEWEMIGPQLERGQIRIPGQILLNQMPRHMLASSAGDFLSSLPAEGIELPLGEVVSRLAPEFFAMPADQAAPDSVADEPPIFDEESVRLALELSSPGSTPIGQPAPAEEPAQQVEQPSGPPEQPEPGPPQQVAGASAPPAEVSAEPQEQVADTGLHERETSVTPAAAGAPAAVETPPAPAPGAQSASAGAEASPAMAPESVQAPATPPHDEQVISSAIAALHRKEQAEEEVEGEEEAAEPLTTPEEGAPATPEAAGPEDAPPPAMPVGDRGALPRDEEAVAETQEKQEAVEQPVDVVAREQLQAPAPEVAASADGDASLPARPAAAEVDETVAEPAPVAQPPPIAQIDPEVEAGLRAALKAVDCRGVELVSTDGVPIVVAHSALGESAELAARFADVVKATHELAAEAGAGAVNSALLMGERGSTFIGSPQNPRAPHLVVTTDSASAGQTTVAARKAIALLESVELKQETTAEAPSSPEAGELPSEDEQLRRIGSAIGQQVGAFRSGDGSGVVAFGLEEDPTPQTAATAQSMWQAAQRAQPGGVDRLLVMGATRTLGLGRAEKADALIVAGFAPAMNPGLVGTETAKVVRMCDDLSAREGIPADAG